jgi:acyl-coenzyme A thioesterase PaaI-like protein
MRYPDRPHAVPGGVPTFPSRAGEEFPSDNQDGTAGKGETAVTDKAFQEQYADRYSHCFGCGRLNDHGLHVKSRWEGDESVCVFEPAAYHIAFPGFVYGGIIASIIDCHSTGTAAAAAARDEGREIGAEPAIRFVTVSLHVDYLRPTPAGTPLELRSRVRETRGRRVVVETFLSARGERCARGEVVAVKIPESMEPA